MLTIFVGSSSEARERNIVSQLVRGLTYEGSPFEVRPWYTLMEQGQFPIESLLKVADTVDLAILVFANDDQRTLRGVPDSVTRDNVVLEYGLFLGQLERERIWVLKENGVALPTDLSGLTVSTFRSAPAHDGKDTVLDADLQQCITEMRHKWKNSRPAGTRTDDAGLGLKKTLRWFEDLLNRIRARLTNFSEDSQKTEKPFHFDSPTACILAYVEALDLVTKRFWTTTYQTSGFWTGDDVRILRANTDMQARLREQNGDIRRLFLLDKSVQESVRAEKDRLIHLRQSKNADEIRRVQTEFKNLKSNLRLLMSEWCKVRVAFDADDYLGLPAQIEFTTGESEIAIYDDFRVDVFGGGRTGQITDAKVYSNATEHFGEMLARVQTYFNRLWDSESAIGAEEYLALLEDAHEGARKRIDYTSNWLAHYEFALPELEREMKNVERSRVEEILRRINRWGEVNRYLDVGTCTARYPIALCSAIKPNGEIIGIDEDIDCVRFAKAQRERLCPDERRISIEWIDFGAKEIRPLGKFDLITCMLGTISHFGWNRARNFVDLQQSVIGRMATLLNDNGIVILSNWSAYAVKQQEMLSIYSESDRNRLAEWTPGLEELKKRIDAAGLEIFDEAHPNMRLDLLACRRKGAATASPASWVLGSLDPVQLANQSDGQRVPA